MNRECVLCDIAEKKSQFKKPVVDAYYHVGQVLDLEQTIETKTQLLQNTTDTESVETLERELEELKSKHTQLQQEINHELTHAVGILGDTISLCKSLQNNSCGHAESNDTGCTRCKEKRELMDIAKKDPLRWLEQVVPNSRFTVLFFYRGTWCGNCPLYLRQINDNITEIRKLGGEAYAISSQEQQFIDQMKQTTEVDYDLISDSKCLLGKKFGVKITKKNGFAFRVMQRIIKGALKSTDSYDHYHDDGITQPAVVVLDNNGGIIYKWVTPALFKTGFGMFDRIDPEEVMEVVRFYFSQPTLVGSVIEYCNQNAAKVFDATLTNPELRALFELHLKKEYSIESLEFVDQAQEFQQLLEKQKSSLLTKKSTVAKKESNIYCMFIPERAPKELNIPGEIRKNVQDSIENHKKKVESFEQHAFALVLQHIKTMLISDSFMRFVRKEQFASVASKLFLKS